MRTTVLLITLLVLQGCVAVMKGLVRNDTGREVHHLTDWKPFEEPIPVGEARKVRLSLPGACIELLLDGESHYFIVPVPPRDSEVKSFWSPIYNVVYNSEGLFFVGKESAPLKFEEVSKCST